MPGADPPSLLAKGITKEAQGWDWALPALFEFMEHHQHFGLLNLNSYKSSLQLQATPKLKYSQGISEITEDVPAPARAPPNPQPLTDPAWREFAKGVAKPDWFY